jgi:hypothetical protein
MQRTDVPINIRTTAMSIMTNITMNSTPFSYNDDGNNGNNSNSSNSRENLGGGSAE